MPPIYLTEADEVLDSIGSSAARLKAQPDDREALTTSRRGFHTLKGSGRMVGLTDLGEIAYDVEKVVRQAKASALRIRTAAGERLAPAAR